MFGLDMPKMPSHPPWGENTTTAAPQILQTSNTSPVKPQCRAQLQASLSNHLLYSELTCDHAFPGLRTLPAAQRGYSSPS